MTVIELTIDYLKDIQCQYMVLGDHDSCPLPEWYALENAIRALEQIPILDNIEKEIEKLETIEHDKNSLYNIGMSDMKDRVMQIIRKYK